jgi:RNA polymerase sporulation-specific sigma factor
MSGQKMREWKLWQKWKIVWRNFWQDGNEILYIGGSEVLPPPLDTEEERRCLIALVGRTDREDGMTQQVDGNVPTKAQQADGGVPTKMAQQADGMTPEEARQMLIAHNLRLVVYLAKKFENTGVGVEDLISIGSIGLIKGINTFNPEKKIKLATYASRCIENEILMYLRRNNKTKLEVSIDEPLNVDWDGNELLLSDILGTEEDIIYRDMETEAEMKLLRVAVGHLDSREREIIELRFGINRRNGKEMTQKEVADALGISQSYISRLEKKIMQRLKREILKFE